MKLSLNWLKKYLNISYTEEKIAEMLTLIGLEVEGYEAIESIKGGLKGVVVGEVKTCEKHADADRLSLTTVDIGSGELLPIVCGAPNVAVGQKVMVATIGTTLYPKNGSPLTIKKGNIRGAASFGMICAEDELGLGSDHDGILVLPPDTLIGMPASEYYNIENDVVFEIGLTPNRSDATSQLGVARDLLAYLRVNEQYQDELNEPDISNYVTEKVAFNIDIEIQNKKDCLRYTGVTISQVEVKESPDRLQKLLMAIGVKPINNIVDITNFVLNELGQPLHAFDADKIAGHKIIVKSSVQGAEFTTLDDVSRKLQSTDLVICDGNEDAMCLAGVYGGKNSGVSTETKNIFLESACFKSTTIRKTSTFHNLRTDAAKIFEKGSDPNITVFAMKRAAALIKEIAGGAISNYYQDEYPAEIKPAEVRLYYANVEKLIGLHIPDEDIHAILQAMDMEISSLDDESILVKIPTNKIDVNREVDLIEEIVRIYGLNRVPVSNLVKSTISYSEYPGKYETKEILANYLAANGFQEMMGLSLIESKNYQGLEFMDPTEFVYINNTSNIHLDIMRPDMLMSGLLSVAYNLNRQQSNLAVFELGKFYRKIENEYVEKEVLTVFMTGKKNAESWLSPKSETSFYDIKKQMLSLLERVGVHQYQLTEIKDDARWTYGLRVHRGADILSEFGEVKKAVCQKMGIKSTVYYGELHLGLLVHWVGKEKIQVQEISKFPSVRRDLAIIISKNTSFKEIETIARQINKKILKHVGLFDVYEHEEHVGRDKKSYAVSFVFESTEKTLQDKEIDAVMEQLKAQLELKLNAFIRK